MKDQRTYGQAKALLRLWHPEENLTDEEVGALIATAYPAIAVQTFVDCFLTSVDENRFDSDTGHVDCPVACVQAALAYQRTGGRFLSGQEREESHL